ncbi:hypothetical protein V8E54_001248 [Elaphomyces granulatus]
MTEDQDLLAKIGQLAGQINQRKNQHAQPQRPFSGRPCAPSRGSRHPPGWAPYRGRGSTHRNRTLVLNNSKSSGADTTPPPGVSSDIDNEIKPSGFNGWVAKRDRHMQLINSAIYDKETQARTRAIEETRMLKAHRRAKLEEDKVVRYAQSIGRQHLGNVSGSTTASYPASYQILVNDIPFQVARGGSKLIRISSALLTRNLASRAGLPFLGDPNTANNTPKRVTVGGVAFVRSKNGNLHRLGAEPATRGLLAAMFTIRIKLPSARNSSKLVTVVLERCAIFPMNHRLTDPLFACISSEGVVRTRNVVILMGAECEERHAYECPDYANGGICNKNKCTLPHVDRAGQIRKNAANKAGTPTPDEDKDDVSSEGEEYDEIDSDDVDSDGLGDDPVELIGSGVDSGELAGQQDFVHF